MATYQTTEFDTENEYDWTSIQFTIEDGVIIRTKTTFDAGYEVYGTYENGVLVEDIFAGPLDSLGFEYRTIKYDASGAITFQSTGYKGLYQLDEYFADGVRTQTIQLDVGAGNGTQTWKKVTYEHDADGNIESSIVEQDNGNLFPSDYRQGVLEFRFDYNNDRSWEGIESQWDANGVLEERITKYDNGIIKAELWDDGVRDQIVLFDSGNQSIGDGIRSWQIITTQFDQNGDLEQRGTIFDNGIVKEEYWEGGNRVSVSQYDNLGREGSGVKNWYQRTTDYDAEGNIVQRFTLLDSSSVNGSGGPGQVNTETFENGVRVGLLQEDLDFTKSWKTIDTKYEAGKVASKNVIYDSGDEVVSVYTDGTRSHVLRYDGDDSSSWNFRVTEFVSGGPNVTTNYDTINDVPAELADYFQTISPEPQKTQYVLDFNDNADIENGDTVLDDTFTVGISKGQSDNQGILTAEEYGGASADTDTEAVNSEGSTIDFKIADGDTFDFESISLANGSTADQASNPTANSANEVTLNGYLDDALVHSIQINLTSDHVTHDLGWTGIDQLELVASGGQTTNDHVENAGLYSMDDLTFLV